MRIRPRPLQAFILAFLIEALVVSGAIMAAGMQTKPSISEPVTIVLAEPETPPPAPVPEVKPLPPVKPLPKPLPKPTPKPLPTPPKQEPIPEPATPVAEAPPAPVPAAETPTASTVPVSRPAPPPPPAPANKGDPNAAYAAKVRAAVQAAVYYPPAAAALHFTGRVRLEFHLRDSVAGEARVIISSGIALIDQAALKAVQSASYPPPPTDMAGSDQLYQIWVEFTRKS